MDVLTYALSVAVLLITVAAPALGAVRIRSRLIPGWSGIPARLADVVITLALLIWIAELSGAVGMLKPLPLIAAAIATGLALRAIVPPPDGDEDLGPPAPPVGRWGRPAAAAIAFVLLAHWSIGTVESLRDGMTGYDSAWYHMPFAAHFAQTGSTLDFASVSPRYLSWFYPANSELLHGVGMTIFHRDVLSPMLNLVWLGGCLGAAWCIGRPYRAGPWTVAAAAVLLDAGVMADQAGEARNDTLGLFFLLAAVAFIVNGAAASPRNSRWGSLALAGLCGGLAAGTKLSLLAPVGALMLGVPALVTAGGRRRAALAFGAPMVAGCGFWYMRNAALAGNPLPWFQAVGPLRLDGPEQGLGGRPQFSVLHYLGDGRVWNHWFEPGLDHRLGELWPLVLAAAAVALLVSLVRAQRPLKLIAFAASAGVAAYLLDGTSAEGPAGFPVGFASSLRHLLPALLLAIVLLPLAPSVSSRRGRLAVTVLLLALLVAADRSAAPWRPLYLALAAAGCALALAAWASALQAPLARIVPRRALLSAAVAAIGGLLAVGWVVQRSYLADRYMGKDFRSPGLNAAFAWASGQRKQRIATTLPLQYPLLGRDLSNTVAFVGQHQQDAGFTAIRRCGPWRAALGAGRYRFVVTTMSRDGPRWGGGQCLAQDRQARVVLRRDRIVVFRLSSSALPGRGRSEARGRGGGVSEPTSSS
jgi:hypothetical protein